MIKHEVVLQIILLPYIHIFKLVILMLDFYLKWKELAQEGLRIGSNTSVLEGNFNKVVVLGVGGSGVIGEFLESISREYEFSVRVSVARYLWDLRGLRLGRTFSIAVSYSGNTTETLECTRYLLSQGVPVIGVTSGGLLREMLSKRGLPVALVPSGLLPRAAMPVMLYACIGYLIKMGLAGKLSYNEALSSINMLESRDEAEREAQELINYIEDKTPVLITVNKYYPLALRVKQELAENAKKLSFIEVLPDAGHNSVVPWGRDPSRKHYKLIAVAGGDEEVYYKAFSRGCNEPLKLWVVKGDSYLEKIMWGAWVAGIFSVKLALRNGYDPSETKEIKEYRKYLSGFIKI